MLTCNPRPYYLDIWEKVFKSEEIKNDCPSVLHIIELLLITPVTNAKLERLFSRMGKVKNDYLAEWAIVKNDCLAEWGGLRMIGGHPFEENAWETCYELVKTDQASSVSIQATPLNYGTVQQHADWDVGDTSIRKNVEQQVLNSH